MIKKIIVEKGNVGNGTKVILCGVGFSKRLMIFENHDCHKPLGTVENIWIDNNNMFIEFEYKEEYNLLYPSIGFMKIKSHFENEINIIEECEIKNIGFCTLPNEDKTIKSIGEQINGI